MSAQILCMYSGGVASFVAAKRGCERYGADNVTLLFCDTKIEDEDTYRFLSEGAEYLGATLISIADGRDPWQIFHDVRFLGNTRADPCSRILKRQLARTWVDLHAPSGTIIVLGLDACEQRRIPNVQRFWQPYRVELPLLWGPDFLDKDLCRRVVRQCGLREPRLYQMGFAHNNCGGFCVKGGQAHFLHLLRALPERYAYHEAQEQALRHELGREVAILRDRRGGTTKPYTMQQFRLNGATDQEEFWGGCGCFTDDEATP